MYLCNLAFYDERNLLETVEKSARSVWLGKIREAIFAILGLQLAEAGSVAVLFGLWRISHV